MPVVVAELGVQFLECEAEGVGRKVIISNIPFCLKGVCYLLPPGFEGDDRVNFGQGGELVDLHLVTGVDGGVFPDVIILVVGFKYELPRGGYFLPPHDGRYNGKQQYGYYSDGRCHDAIV